MLMYLQMMDGPEEQSKFETIYQEYRELMFYVAYQILHHQQDAEDAVQCAFIKIAENMKKIADPVCPKTRSYVVIIVENKAIDVLRSRKRHSTVEFNETCCVSVDHDSDHTLAKCILQLPPRYREVILLKYCHGYSLREIAQIMSISLPAAIKLDQRAKKKLQTLYEEGGVL